MVWNVSKSLGTSLWLSQEPLSLSSIWPWFISCLSLAFRVPAQVVWFLFIYFCCCCEWKQWVFLDGVLAHGLSFQVRVPQGNVFGSMLFLICIDDISGSLENQLYHLPITQLCVEWCIILVKGQSPLNPFHQNWTRYAAGQLLGTWCSTPENQMSSQPLHKYWQTKYPIHLSGQPLEKVELQELPDLTICMP